MKYQTLIALIGAATAAQKANIRFCTKNAECRGKDGGAYDKGGCCNFWTALELAQDGKPGKFEQVWKLRSQKKALVPGATWGACMPAAYRDETRDQL